MAADGKLHPQIEARAPWTKIAEVADQYMDRRLAGKVVLQVTNE
jgi:NADPH:quinone reductase-like Zn-dependent oxidoreductase